MPLSRLITERSLRRVSRRLVAARRDLAEVLEQAAALTEEADDLELRALMSDAPLDRAEAREAGGHRASFARQVERLRAEITRLEQRQDVLLDRLGGR
jgi:phage shock protein A